METYQRGVVFSSSRQNSSGFGVVT